MTQTNRPKWALCLSRAEWRKLQTCQNTKRPTLSALRRDVAHQRSVNVTCWDCERALRAVTNDQYLTRA